MGLEDVGDDSEEISLSVDQGVLGEVERLRKITGLSIGQQFTKGYSLFCIVVDAYENGGTIYRRDSSGNDVIIRVPGYNSVDDKK